PSIVPQGRQRLFARLWASDPLYQVNLGLLEMLEFWIANLIVDEANFEVPSTVGKWEFVRADFYADSVSAIEKGMVAHTYYASNTSIGLRSPDAHFDAACDELIDICLVLSFLTARCVTPVGDT